MKISKNTSRLFALLMAVVMLVGMLPVSAFAAANDTVTGKIFTEASTLENGATYVIVSTNSNNDTMALDITEATWNGTSSGTRYQYDGFEGTEVSVSGGKITSDVKEAMLWQINIVNGKYTVKNVSANKFLKGTYVSNTGTLSLSDDAFEWTISGDQFKFNDGSKDRFISNDDSANRFDHFTVRSSGTDLTFYKVTEATNGDDDDDDQGSTDPTTPPAGSEEYYSKVSSVTNGQYVIVASDATNGDKALNTEKKSTTSSSTTYAGVSGKKVTINDNKIAVSAVEEDMIWNVTVVGGKLRIQNADTKDYLGVDYTSGSSYRREVKLGAHDDDWTLYDNGRMGTDDNDGNCYLVHYNSNIISVRSNSQNTTVFATVTFYKVGELQVDPDDDNQGGGTTEPKTVEITTNNSASAATEDVSIAVGESFTLKLTNGSGSSKTHAISNTDSSVASVDASNNFSISGNGTKEITITGLKNGKTTITFTGTSSGGSTYYAVVNVTVGTGAGGNQGGGTTETETVEITATSGSGGATGSAEIEVGQTLVIKLTNGSSNNTKNYTTEVANEQVASVVSGAELSLSKSATGEITVLGVSAGTTTIVSTSDVGSGSNTYKATINLTVTGEGTVAPPAGGEDDDEIAKTADIHLAFTSDIHNNGSATTNGTGANNLTKWLEAVAKKNNDTFDTMGFTGDHGDRNQNSSTYWSRVQTVMDVVSGSDYVDATEGFFVDGNHEYHNGSQNRDHTNSNATSKKIKKIGEKLVADDYVLYSFGAASGNQAFDSNDITALDNYLKTVDGQKPVFVLSHFPIHYYNSRTTNNAQALVNVLNNYPNVIFLWGHNHTLSDSYYDEVYAAGSELPLTSSSSSKVKINFTYAGAGCMADSSTAAGVQADGLVAKVDGNKVTLTYYNVNANVVGQSTTITIEEKEEHSHTYGNPVVDWANDYKTATVSVTCGECAEGTDGKTVSATVNATVTTTPGDCKTKATTTYTIPAGTIGGKNYSAAEKTVEGALGDHDYSTEWKSNDDKHWHECSKCGDQKDAADHTPGAAATETDPQLCTVCEYVITPATGHVNHDFSVAVEGGVTPATCTQTGTEVKKCSGCELTQTTTLPVDANAHSWNAGVITTPATCTTAGVKTFTCQHNSAHTKTEAVAIDEDAHNFDEGECEYCGEADPDYVPDDGEPAYIKINASDIKVNDKIIIVGKSGNSYYALTNGSNQRTAVTVSGNEVTVSGSADALIWTVGEATGKQVDGNNNHYMDYVFTNGGKSFGRITSENTIEFKSGNDANTKYFGHIAYNGTIGNYSTGGDYYGLLYQSNQFIYVQNANNSGNNASVLFFKVINVVDDEPDAPHTHTYGAPSYTGDGMTSYVATRECACGDIQTATATITSAVTTPATCTAAGVRTYTANFTETWAVDKNTTEAITKLDHDFEDGECSVCGAPDPDYVPEPAGNPTKVTSLVAGKYVIASGSKALTSAVNSGYTNSYNYAYSGFNGANVTISGNEITGGATQDMEFELAASGNGFTIKHVASGKYLNATYTKNSGNDGWTGVLTLSNTQDVWTWDASTGYLKSANASNNSDNKSMYFTFDDRENNGATGNFFGIRSGGSSNNYDNVDKIDFYLIGAPLDDDNQGGNPGGGNPGGGNQGGGNQGGTEVPEQPTKVTTLKAGQYVLVSNDNKKALTTTTHNGYTNTNNYSYSGFNGADVTISGNVITNGATQDMVFEVAVVSGGYTIKNVAKNQYLTASYGSNSSGAYTGALTLSATAETWEWDSSNGRLKSTKASNNDRGLGVYLTFDDKPDTVSSGSGNFFGVRTEGSNHDYANVDHIDFYLVGEALDDGQGGNPGGGNAGNGNGSTVYVAFTSDVHSKTTDANQSGQSPYRLNQWLTSVGNNVGQKFEDMVFCGDNADGSGASNDDNYWAMVQTVMDVAKNNTNLKTEGKFLAGNHEWENGKLGTTTNATAKKIQSVGTKVVTDNYVLYLFGATSSDQKNTGFKTADITALDNYLSTAPTDRPIFITSHFPIHTFGSRSTANASALIDTLNKHGEKLDLYFIWGHNHSQSDNNYDKFFDDDDQLLSKDINFVYCAAGAMSDSEYQGSGNVKGKGLVAKIVSGKVESLSYYGTSYTVTSSYKPTYTGGTVTPDQPQLPDHDHSWDNGTVTTQPTCYAVGVKTYKCTICDATKTEDIAKVDHDVQTTWTSDTTSHWHDCNNCTAQIDLAEHTWDEGTVITEATDTKPGTMEYTCTVCAQTKLEDIAALDHDLASVWSSDETYHWVECNTCDELVNKAEHTWDEGTVTTAPTCTATGVKTITCTVCALAKTEEIAATGHTYTEWTKVDDSTHESACACGEKTTAEHTWDEGVISIAATCGTAGEKTYTCSVCTGTKAEVIPATGEHVFEDEKCTVCGANEKDIVLVAPEILSCYSKVQTAVKVTWTLVDHADGYELWRTSTPDDADSWVRAKTIKDGTKDRYTNQDLDKGVTYYYKVRAYMEDANGNKTYSAFSDVDYMPATVVWDGPYSNATFRIRLRWNEIGGAHGYQIWRLNEDGETWSVVKTLGDRNNILTDNQGATTAYSNTGLEAGEQYTYKMRAFMIPEEGRKVFGAYSDEFTIAVMPETPEITVTSPKATRAQIEWDEINGAAGYQVWMQNPKSDAGWAIVKSVTDGNTAYTKYDLKSGTTYEFKVRAYTEVDGKKTFGAYSEVISIKVK